MSVFLPQRSQKAWVAVLTRTILSSVEEKSQLAIKKPSMAGKMSIRSFSPTVEAFISDFIWLFSYLFYNFASVSDCIHCKSYFMITLNLHIFGDNR